VDIGVFGWKEEIWLRVWILVCLGGKRRFGREKGEGRREGGENDESTFYSFFIIFASGRCMQTFNKFMFEAGGMSNSTYIKYPLKNDVAFKITIGRMIDQMIILIKL
jgi:hypothetical protein